MISFAFIITSVKFQFKLISAQIFLPMISCNKLSITQPTIRDNGGIITRCGRSEIASFSRMYIKLLICWTIFLKKLVSYKNELLK